MIRRPTPLAALVFVAGVAILFVFGGVGLHLLLGEHGIVASEWLLLFAPAVYFVRAGGFDARETLFLARPSLRGLAAGLLLVAGATPVAWAIGWVQSFFVTVPPEVVEAMEEMLTARSPGRLAWLLLAVALTPALCEEVVFRGVLLSSTRDLALWRALVLNGVIFGAFHFSVDTPIRFLPTAWLGIVIAWAVLRSGSVWTGVLMHFVNNGAIVVLASVPAASRVVTDPQAPPPPWLLVGAAVALGLGSGVMAHEPPTRFSRDTTILEDHP
ncbi:MAG: hypothetical protein AMXMBFR53_32400 [Gemmatimonadota bacterium]